MTELEMTSLLFKLADLGITGIKVFYEGGGDSGAIEYIVVTKEKLSNDDDIAFDKIKALSGWSSDDNELLRDIDEELYDKIHDYTTMHILDNIEDWWNNEGGWGELCILIPSGKFRIDNNINFTRSELFEHSGDLISKTLTR